MNTKDLFINDYLDRVKRTNNGVILTSEVISSVLTKITGNRVFHLDTPSPSKSFSLIFSKPSEEDKKKFQELYDNIKSDYGLTEEELFLVSVKGEEYFNPDFSGFSKNSSLEYSNYFLFGDEFVCTTIRSPKLECPFICNMYYTSKSSEIAKNIWIRYSEMCYEVVKDHEEETRKTYQITTVVVGEHGEYDPIVTAVTPTVSLLSPDFIDNYNTDLPEERIKKFFDMDRGGIMIFNGCPGCGKSTYIKSIIFKNTDINFIILPQYLLLNQEALRNLLFRMSSSEKDSIYIIEDCEQLLIQRESNSAKFSSVIGDILNYTDGIFGDLTRTKFIFTFNTDINNIDKAILRPGRLFLKYEFTPLRGENLEKIASKLGVTLSDLDKRNGVPLANLYMNSRNEDLLVGSRPKRRIGFKCGEATIESGGVGIFEEKDICEPE